MSSNSDEQAKLTWVNGRAYRNEAREPNPKYGVTTADMARLRMRQIEAAEFRRTLSNLALAQAMALGKRLNALKR